MWDQYCEKVKKKQTEACNILMMTDFRSLIHHQFS